MISINTQYFRESAIYYQKHGCYDDGVFNSYHYHDFWDEEYKRCIEGYSVGGMYITGYHYWYLNHWPIIVTRKVEEDLYGEVLKKKRAIREVNFADFWDVDYEFFIQIEEAEKHGEHFVWLKPRGVGASYKGSGMAGRNFFCIRNSKNFLFAHLGEYLTSDGLFTKWLLGRSYINKPHPKESRYLSAFGKPSDYKKDINGMHFRASSNINGEERGYMSELMGVSFKDDYQKGRGKRGKLILWEEMGAFPNVDKAWNITRDSVEEQDAVYGLMLGFGTGGTKAADFGAMEKMFYNPKAYNIRCFDNIWDEGMKGTKSAYFTSATRTIQFKDKDGNSDEIKARKFYEHEREEARKSPDPNVIIQRKAEHPFTPQEAILNVSNSILPANEAREWRVKVLGQKLYNLGIPGELKNVDGHIKFFPNDTLKPIMDYPHNIKEDLTGAVVVYYPPYKKDGKVPEDTYIISVDPYAFDQSTDMESIGAVYVYMQPNRFQPPGDRLVATYFGRPKLLDDFNKNLFNLAIYYNAKIGIESDRGNTIDYAKRFKLLDYLADEFELAFDADISTSKVKRGFGMHMGSGKDNLRKNKGDKYLADWLMTPRGTTEDGIVRLNLHTIYCPATLKEIETYRSDGGNFDRISSLRILAYHMKELDYNETVPQEQTNTYRDSIFNRPLFQ